MPQPEWHVDKYQEAQRLVTDLRELILKRRAGNVSYMAECLKELEVLTNVVDVIRTIG